MRPRIREELAYLREHYDDVVHAEKDGEDWFLLPSYPIPPGWRVDAVSVTHLPTAFQVKPGYPGVAPYGFLVPRRTSCSDSAPDNSGDPPSEPPFPGDWLHLSWTVEDWSPAAEVRGGSNLVAWCRSFRVRFLEGK